MEHSILVIKGNKKRKEKTVRPNGFSNPQPSSGPSRLYKVFAIEKTLK
jgi:hypothetical protein